MPKDSLSSLSETAPWSDAWTAVKCPLALLSLPSCARVRACHLTDWGLHFILLTFNKSGIPLLHVFIACVCVCFLYSRNSRAGLYSTQKIVEKSGGWLRWFNFLLCNQLLYSGTECRGSFGKFHQLHRVCVKYLYLIHTYKL